MENREFYVMNAWRDLVGMEEMPEGIYVRPEPFDLKKLTDSEWSPKFEEYMRHRLIFGAQRYGKLNGKNKPKYDYVDSIIKRAEMYRKTGNQEYLVDIANCCLVEFAQNGHPNAHFSPADDDGVHVEIKT